MRSPFRQRPSGRRRRNVWVLRVAMGIAVSRLTTAITFHPVPSPNLDLDNLGRVAVAGDFSGISLYQFEEQSEQPYFTNGSQSLLARLPNGAFTSILESDAAIQAMCSLTSRDGTVTGVMVGGTFTSLGREESNGIALFDMNSLVLSPISGLSGQVNALLCDASTESVYVGGNFVAANSTNAIKWDRHTGFTNLPFAGFNGPVSSITRAGDGHIIFGGSFTGLGNASLPGEPDSQIINLSTANISATSTSTATGFTDPATIVCSNTGGAGKTWLLADNTPGSWQAKFRFGFRPTKLRLYNTRLDGRGTKTFRFTAFPINGIMNFTYIDPATGNNATCTSECPMSNSETLQFQEYRFVNVIGMNEFRIDISDWHGQGGGLNGIELFEDDIFSYAVSEFNEPTCAGGQFPSSVTRTGPWTVTPSASSSADYVTAQIHGPITQTSASIVFTPNIKESGAYSVNLYTPGCLQDDTCSTRGQVRITGRMTAKGGEDREIDKILFQTNDFDKYDQIYFGDIDASSSSFRPEVTMTPVSGQNLDIQTFVAQKVGFSIIKSTGGLVGLFEFDPASTAVATSDFSNSVYDQLGSSFEQSSAVNALASGGNIVYVGGNFTSSNVSNIAAVKASKTAESLDGGLNGIVTTMYLNGTNLYVGGSFNNTRDNKVQGLNNLGVYDTETNAWSPLGAGVNGRVNRVVPLVMNVTCSTPELVISVNGHFTRLEAFDKNSAVTVANFGVWIPSQRNWLQNLELPIESINGILQAAILYLPNETSLYAGSVSSSTLGVNGAALLDKDATSLAKFVANIHPTPPGLSYGVATGFFDISKDRKLTILGGHFTATSSSDSIITNLVIIDDKNHGIVTGFGSEVSPDSTFLALAVQDDILWAGGNVTGRINSASRRGVVLYNLATNSFANQPPSLNGQTVKVTAITVRPESNDVYVGGSFETAGSLDCPAVCFFSASSSQWNQPGSNLGGTVNTMMWTDKNTLVVGGNLKINGSSTTPLAIYNANRRAWDRFSGADQLPGPVQVVKDGNLKATRIWVSGTASNGSVYFMKHDESGWFNPGLTFAKGSVVRDLQVFKLKEGHGDTPLLEDRQALVLTGSLILPNANSSVSAAIYDGKTLTPFALTTNMGNTVGSIGHIFAERNNGFFDSGGGHLPLVFVVLIGLGISLVLMLLIVVAGLFLDRLRKKRDGYVQAPTSMCDRVTGLQRVPPQELLESLGRGQPGAPRI